MGDLDHFKKFNDVYGHAAGDKIIVQIGKLFKERFRGSDIACRYGGEEFLIILPETSLEDTFKRADALREEIKKMEMVFQGQILGSITMSMGIASYPEKGTRMEELLRVADTAFIKPSRKAGIELSPANPRHCRPSDEGRGNLTFILFIAFLVNRSSCSNLLNTL